MPSELIPHQPGTLQPRLPGTEPTMLEMIQQTITSGEVPAEKLPAVLSAFFDFQQKINAANAEQAFNRDFAAALLEMPRVAKRGRKDMGGKGTIMYATYEDLDAAIRPIEAKYGFARSFSTKAEKTNVTLTLRLAHRGGHVLTSERYCPPDPGPGRNDVQAMGSGESYGRRYLTLSVWNIVTVGADDDGDSADPISDEQAMQIRDMLDALALTPPQLAKFWAWVGPPATSSESIQRKDYEKVAAWLRQQVKAVRR